jgi:hypothetical protein
MDLFNRMSQLEGQYNIPRGTLRFKEGEECQGVGCGPFVDLSPQTVPKRRAFLCLRHASIHECSDDCTAGGRACVVHAHVVAQRWREIQREVWSAHPSKTMGAHFLSKKNVPFLSFWSEKEKEHLPRQASDRQT